MWQVYASVRVFAKLIHVQLRRVSCVCSVGLQRLSQPTCKDWDTVCIIASRDNHHIILCDIGVEHTIVAHNTIVEYT